MIADSHCVECRLFEAVVVDCSDSREAEGRFRHRSWLLLLRLQMMNPLRQLPMILGSPFFVLLVQLFDFLELRILQLRNNEREDRR